MLSKEKNEGSYLFTVTNVYYFSVKILQKFRHFSFCIFDDIGDFNIIQSANYRATCNALDKTKLLATFCRHWHCFKLVIFA